MEKEQKKRVTWICSPVKLTIGILVSNSIKTVRRCLDSLKPILAAVNSELIVVDTVGEEHSDGSLAIAREYTKKIFHFEWCDDFAAARNVCLEHAQGEWFLFVDDDEWFDDTKELIDFFLSGECDSYCQAVYNIRNYNADGSYVLAIMSRLFRRTATMRFIGKVHETVNEVYLPSKKFSFCANHSGYAFENDAERLKKQKRNVTILEKEIEEEGLNVSRAAQMVQELLNRTETAGQGFERCMRYIAELAPTGQLKETMGQWLLIASVRYFSIIGNHEELLHQAEWLRGNFELSQTAELALAVTVIFPAAAIDRMEVVDEYAKLYFKNYDWLNANPEEALLQFQLDFPAFCTEEYYQKIVYVAAVTANCLRDYRLANDYWKRLPWKQPGFDGSRFAGDVQVTIQGMQRIKKWKETEELLRLLGQAKELVVAKANIGFASEADYSAWMDLLQGMQETAIVIGTSVDELVGEGTDVVKYLEEFCELVWQCSQTAELETRNATFAELQRLFEKIMLNYAEMCNKI